jgi:hypothetical protein
VDGGGNQTLLHLRLGTPPNGGDDQCLSAEPGVFGACVVERPPSGLWYASYELIAGLGGDFQLSATAFDTPCSLDLDADGQFDALTDGLLYARSLAGYTGASLTDEVLGAGATRASPETIGAFLASDSCKRELDVDGDGERASATDGLLVLRYLFGFSGEALVSGALAPGAARTSPEAIRQWLDALRR